jgi:hypothetical protein
MSFKKISISSVIIGLFCVTTIFAQLPAHSTAVGNVSTNPDITPPPNRPRAGSGIFNVEDYFAAGETLADNAIRRAIEAAISAGDGGIIYFPKGFYQVLNTIVIGNGTATGWDAGVGHFISLKGEGRGTSVIVAQHNGVVIDFRGGLWVPDAGGSGEDSYANLSNFNSVSDLGIQKWGNAPGSSGQAISFRRASRPIVENVMIQAQNGIGYEYGIVLAQDEARVYNTTISSCGNGILIFGHPNATTISDSWFLNNSIGIYVGGGAGIRILNNTFGTNSIAAIQVATNSPHHPTASIWVLEISGNEIEGCGAGQTGTAFQHNAIWFENRLIGLPQSDYAKGVTISNNYFNMEGLVNGSEVSLSSPYDISNSGQQKEITFNRNIYQIGNGGNPKVAYAVVSEGMTISQIPVTVNANAATGPIPLSLGGIQIKTGVVNPSGKDGAPVGSLYLRLGGGVNTTLWVKTGSSTWTAK